MTQSDHPNLVETRLARAIAESLEGVPVGESVPLTAASSVCRYLERYIPEVLEATYPEWAGESLDAVNVARALKGSDHRLELLGTGILLSDQTVTPLLASIRICATGDSVCEHTLRIGEPGSGPLGISGPPCNSGAASRLLYRLANRVELDRVAWVYSAVRVGNTSG